MKRAALLPLATAFPANATAAGKAQNRSVELLLEGGSATP